MSILWCGGEDIDFSIGAATSFFSNTAAFRNTYARGAYFVGSNADARSVAFSGGAITSCWLSFQISANSNATASKRLFGLSKSGTNAMLLLATASASGTRLALSKWDGSTLTQLAAEAGNNYSGLLRVDLQLVNYGASAVVNVYVNSIQVISFSGDVTVLGNTSLDQVVLIGATATQPLISEVIVANEDTRSFPGLMTLALTGAGTTDSWSGVFSTINQTTISDTSPNFTNTAAQDQQFNITDLPTGGAFVIKAVKIAARMAVSATPTATKVSLGYNSGGSAAFGTGAQKTLTTAYLTYEQLDATNPVTTAAWAQSDMNALQLDMRSA